MTYLCNLPRRNEGKKCLQTLKKYKISFALLFCCHIIGTSLTTKKSKNSDFCINSSKAMEPSMSFQESLLN